MTSRCDNGYARGIKNSQRMVRSCAIMFLKLLVIDPAGQFSVRVHRAITNNRFFPSHKYFTINLLFYLGGQVNKKDNMNIFKQIVAGVNNIHSQGLIHRDLKVSEGDSSF